MINSLALHNMFDRDWSKLHDNIRAHIDLQQRVSYNIASISNYTSHHENFHSDVWGFLLDPTGSHKQNDLFLKLFLRYLSSLNIITSDDEAKFIGARILREKGRIDISIVDKANSACIIIENKINNARDQKDQMLRYYRYAKKQDLTVVAMLYVSAQGERQAVLIDGPVITPIAVSNGSPNDLINGWISVCRSSISYDGSEAFEDIRSLIHQYYLLLKHLTISSMKVQTAKTLYEYLNKSEDFNTAIAISEQLDNLKYYRHQLFIEQMGNNYFKPFGSQTIYSKEYPNHMIFKYWKHHNDTNFQLDIAHYKDRTEFTFYEKDNKLTGNQMMYLLSELQEATNYHLKEDMLNVQHYKFVMGMVDGYKTLQELDEHVVKYAILLFNKIQCLNADNEFRIPQ